MGKSLLVSLFWRLSLLPFLFASVVVDLMALHAGYNPGSATTAANSTSNEDFSGPQFKESNAYMTGQQVENGKAKAANFPFCTIEPNVGIVAVPDPHDVMNIDGLLSDEETPTSSDSAGSSVSDIGSTDNCFWFDYYSINRGALIVRIVIDSILSIGLMAQGNSVRHLTSQLKEFFNVEGNFGVCVMPMESHPV
ncbi:hypothetical protein Tco_0750863 [Tanacetum coccineum]|uniref:Uncharacterized protein n=1 Tax=Tanacetum coccineum TaxID=301880 RepID=A0ABQ4Z566_9ASTR